MMQPQNQITTQKTQFNQSRGSFVSDPQVSSVAKMDRIGYGPQAARTQVQPLSQTHSGVNSGIDNSYHGKKK
ncbi:unnamed protein product, partial [Rotaria sp. Silwood1]